jgi:alpha-galactosidase/6-phospho-beta-glucosidase family protein
VEGRGGPSIAFVGGGSYQWGPKIIQDVALNEELRGGTLILQRVPEACDLVPVASVYSARDLVQDCGIFYLFVFC